MGTFQFKSVRELGAGGFGNVDEVVVVSSDRSYAVGTRLARKRLNSKWASNPEATERFEREIRALKSMKHEGIVPYKGENISDSTERFYFMPLYPSSLRAVLGVNPSGFDWKVIVDYIIPVTEAMEHAHTSGFTHRDFKPENILLTTEGAPIIADWGLGYFLHKESVVLDLTKAGMGTEYYCSREQWLTGKCGPPGDVYSMGIVIAELITGSVRRSPMPLPGAGIRTNLLAETSVQAKKLNGLVRRMTSELPQHRPQTMREVRSTLLEISFENLLEL